jgi:hypothetical protein
MPSARRWRGECAGGAIQIVAVLVLLAIVDSLDTALHFLATGQEGSDKLFRPLAIRVGLSVAPDYDYLPTPICCMSVALSQNKYSSSMTPCLVQWPSVAIGRWYALPVG